MEKPFDESISADAFDLKLQGEYEQQLRDDHHLEQDHQITTPTANGPCWNETLEKFIILCRSRLEDTSNRRKKRYYNLRRYVSRYNASHLWNQKTFECLIRKFSRLLEADQVDNEQANEIYSSLMRELALLTGQSICSGRCRKKKKKSKTEAALFKLEKSLAVVQRRITRLKEESSANTWEARDVRCFKLQGMQKKALRLTKKINELSKLASAGSTTNLNQSSSIKNESDKETGAGSVSNNNSEGDMEELNCLLKSVRLKESIKLKPKGVKLQGGRIGDMKLSVLLPRVEMVEIKKYDQQNQCYVETSPKKPTQAKSSPVRRMRGRSYFQQAIQLKSRKKSSFDLICDRFRHVTLNS